MGYQRNENIICFWGCQDQAYQFEKASRLHTPKLNSSLAREKNQKCSSIRYLNLSILSLDVVVYTCYKYKADRRVIHPTSVRRNIKLKDAVRVALFVVFCIVFCRSLFVLFLLAIVMSFLLWFTASDSLFGILKLFFVYSVYWCMKAYQTEWVMTARHMTTYTFLSLSVCNL
jgi:hypothetical protein